MERFEDLVDLQHRKTVQGCFPVECPNVNTETITSILLPHHHFYSLPYPPPPVCEKVASFPDRNLVEGMDTVADGPGVSQLVSTNRGPAKQQML